jgi:hypothetical protein
MLSSSGIRGLDPRAGWWVRPRPWGVNATRFRHQVTNGADAAGAPEDEALRPLAQGNSEPPAHGNREHLALGLLAQRSREAAVDRNTDSGCKPRRTTLHYRGTVPKSSSSSHAWRPDSSTRGTIDMRTPQLGRVPVGVWPTVQLRREAAKPASNASISPVVRSHECGYRPMTGASAGAPPLAVANS